MLATNSTVLKGTETFDEAFKLIPDRSENVLVRPLYTKEGNDFSEVVYSQISYDSGTTWQPPFKLKTDKEGQVVPINLNSKNKLANAGLFYDVFTQPTLAGADQKNSWLIGNIDGCRILGEDYNIQGMIISSIFDPLPKYYISFERIFCENQFGTLGKNNASMYIDMNAFLHQYSEEKKERLVALISEESEKRISEANRIYEKLATTHLTDAQIKHMFEMLTVNKVAKNNEKLYHEAELQLAEYMRVYNVEDNQNFRGSLFGFVNACTNINTRQRKNPLDVIKPVLPADVIDSPCNFDYLCRAAVLQNVA